MRIPRFIVPISTLILVLIPQVGFAATLGNFDPIIPQSGSCLCLNSAPSWGCILQVLQHLINIAISFGVIICVFYLAYAGALFIGSSANPGLRSQGKQRLMNGAVGLLVILSAWLVVDFVMKTLYNDDTKTGFGPWNAILASKGNDDCLAVNEHPLTLVDGAISFLNTITSTPVDSTAGVNTQASGDCSPTALTNDWGSPQKGALFSCIINNESKCQNIATGAKSEVAGKGSSAGGRYQVLASTNGLNFPGCLAVAKSKGFTGTTLNCQNYFPNGVSNGSPMAGICRSAQLDPTCNTQAAQYLYAHGGVKHWLGVGDVGGKNAACVSRYGR